MKIGIMSDSHDNVPKIKKAVSLFNEQPVNLVIHAGDLVSPFSAKELKKLDARLVAVFGNNDGERLGLLRILGDKIHLAPHEIKVADKKVLIAHEPYALAALQQSTYYDAIIYGHTHEIDVQTTSKPIVINPGECGGWLNGKCTVVLWDSVSNKVDIIEL